MSDEDPLLSQLKALPARKSEYDAAPKARAAFERAFGQRVTTTVEVQADGSLIARSIVPVFLAGVVAIYLMWAFASVLALQG